MGLSINCWKYLLLTFYVLFAISSVAVVCGSGFLLYRLFSYRQFVGPRVQYPAVLLLLLGLVAAAVVRLGWRAAFTLHRVHVIISGVLVGALVAAEVGCSIWSLVVWDLVELDLRGHLTDYFTSTALLNASNSVDALRWDRLHVQMQCCGVSGPSDYSSAGHVPFSCCGQGPLDALQRPYAADCTTLYQRGCGRPLYQYTREQLLYLALSALTAALLQSVGVFLTWGLSRALSRARCVLREAPRSAPDAALLAAPTAPQHTLPKY